MKMVAFTVVCETAECVNRGEVVNEVRDILEQNKDLFAEAFGHGGETQADYCKFCGHLGTLQAEETQDNGGAAVVRRQVIYIDGKPAITVVSDRHGCAELTSDLTNEEDNVQWAVNTKEAISHIIFDYEYEEPEERPLEETCNALGEQIRDEIACNAYESGVNGIESFILALAAEGIDIEDQRFSRALFAALQALSNEN